MAPGSEPRLIFETDLWVQPIGWTPDGALLAIGVDRLTDIGCIAVVSDGRYECIVETNWWARLSPDGRWLVYQTEETGRPEIYVASFPDAALPWQVSEQGGSGPIWGIDGRHVYYQQGQALIAAQVDTASRRVQSREVVLDPFLVARPDDYDVRPDHGAIALIRPVASPQQDVVVVVAHWLTELERRMGR